MLTILPVFKPWGYTPVLYEMPKGGVFSSNTEVSIMGNLYFFLNVNLENSKVWTILLQSYT